MYKWKSRYFVSLTTHPINAAAKLDQWDTCLTARLVKNMTELNIFSIRLSQPVTSFIRTRGILSQNNLSFVQKLRGPPKEIFACQSPCQVLSMVVNICDWHIISVFKFWSNLLPLCRKTTEEHVSLRLISVQISVTTVFQSTYNSFAFGFSYSNEIILMPMKSVNRV